MASSRAAITTPALDLLCVGGLSIVALAPVIWLGAESARWLPAEIVALTLLVNAPHFMASYWLVYSSWENVRRYRSASLWVPLGLLVWVLLALITSRSSGFLTDTIFIVAGAYLAWHYTGQAWGMVSVFSSLAGKPFSDRERAIVRTALRIMLAWHVSWFAAVNWDLPGWLEEIVAPIYLAATWASLVSLALSLWALWLYWTRTGSLPPARAGVAWIAIYVWYAAMARFPDAIFYVQIAHSVQYLIFPARVELNRLSGLGARQRVTQMLMFAATLLIAGGLVFGVLPAVIGGGGVVAALFGSNAEIVMPRLVISFVNIHHFFTDGVIWKMRNPRVRRELYTHLPARS